VALPIVMHPVGGIAVSYRKPEVLYQANTKVTGTIEVWCYKGNTLEKLGI
jgi:hypothetical protein